MLNCCLRCPCPFVQAYGVAAPYIEQGVKAASPIVEQAAKVTVDVTTPLIQQALPALNVSLACTTRLSLSISLEPPPPPRPRLAQTLHTHSRNACMQEAEKSLEASIKSSPSFDSLVSGANTLATGVHSLVSTAGKAVTAATPVASQVCACVCMCAYACMHLCV